MNQSVVGRDNLPATVPVHSLVIDVAAVLVNLELIGTHPMTVQACVNYIGMKVQEQDSSPPPCILHDPLNIFDR